MSLRFGRLLLCIFLVPTSSARLEADVGPVSASLTDGYTTTCDALSPISESCFILHADHDTIGPGDDEIWFTPNWTACLDVIAPAFLPENHVDVVPWSLRVPFALVATYDMAHDVAYPEAAKPFVDLDPSRSGFSDTRPVLQPEDPTDPVAIIHEDQN